MNRTLILVRHGEPQMHAGKKGKLTIAGEKASIELGQSILSETPKGTTTTILSSRALRCVQTARAIQQNCGGSIVMANLRLFNADRLTIANNQSKFSTYIQSYAALGIESPEQYFTRIQTLIHHQKGDTIVVVGHEVGLKIILSIAANIPSARPLRYSQQHKLLLRESSTDGTIRSIQI